MDLLIEFTAAGLLASMACGKMNLTDKIPVKD
jgi:hypothetical protein